MDVTDITPQLDKLDGELDDLEEVLKPILDGLSDVSSKLPLLDKAKLYVLVTYSIESVLFSALRLNDVDAKQHPIFKELTRVRQYFEKIKEIENPPQKPEQSLNKEAAIRFIKADLADNKEVNTQLSEMIAKERAIAALKKARGGAQKRKAEIEGEAVAEEAEPGSQEVSAADNENQQAEAAGDADKDKKKKRRKGKHGKGKKSAT